MDHARCALFGRRRVCSIVSFFFSSRRRHTRYWRDWSSDVCSSDPLFRQIDLPKQELRDLAELCPGVTHSLQRLYAAYTEARRGETMVAAQMADRDEGTRFEANPIERVRDLIEANRNYFPELETAAENLRDELDVAPDGLFASLSERLREKHSIVTRIMPVDVMRETLRRFDRHRRQLLISELVGGSGR